MGAARPRVVVIGGGFGGLEATKALKNDDVSVTLLDRRNHHLFQPLLYQVATAALNPADIATPLRSVLRKQKNAEVFLADAKRIDLNAKKVILADGEVPYDYLVVATGATHSYLGKDEWEKVAPGLKTIEDALEIRRRVLYAYEAAEREPDPERRRAWMTFVIVGAGATGAELAGAFAEISRSTLKRDFRHIDPGSARILLVEYAPHVLPTFVESLSEKARHQLEKLGVEVHTGVKVTHIDENCVETGDTRIETKTVIWAAGVRASSLVQTLGVPLDRAGRVIVEPDLSIPGHPEVMVVGDTASMQQDGKPVFGVAPAALQAGRHAARNIRRMVRGERPEPFHYVDKGSLATLGRKAGIADIRGLRLSGFLAWAAWLLVHVFFLIGFRNRLMVLLEWAWSYLTFQRGARLITGNPPEALEDLPRLTKSASGAVAPVPSTPTPVASPPQHLH